MVDSKKDDKKKEAPTEVTTKADAKVAQIEKNIIEPAEEAGRNPPTKGEVMAKAKAAGLDELPPNPNEIVRDDIDAGDRTPDEVLEDQVDAAIESDVPPHASSKPRTAHSDDDPVAETVKTPKLREYVVTAGAGIAPLGNHRKARAEHGDRARMYKAGEIVHLTAKEARHYIANKSLDPYVPNDDED